ncbi:MAG TPA: hypothetical protein VGP06_16985, partial [Janthinobacterium sp.]|nr:hypothetical protein [Janthinobacterium sp.]
RHAAAIHVQRLTGHVGGGVAGQAGALVAPVTMAVLLASFIALPSSWTERWRACGTPMAGMEANFNQSGARTDCYLRHRPGWTIRRDGTIRGLLLKIKGAS